METRKPSSLGLRVIAALIDSLLMFLIWYYTIEIWGHTQSLSAQASITAGGDKVLTGWAAIWVLLGTAAYWIVPEWIAGATIGKFICGLRVRSLDGKAISLRQSIKRNLLRIIDCFPFYITGFVSALLTPNRQRLGDLWANTFVARKKDNVANVTQVPLGRSATS